MALLPFAGNRWSLGSLPTQGILTLQMDLLWNVRFVVWGIVGSIRLFWAAKSLVSLSHFRNYLVLMTVSYGFFLLSLTSVFKWKLYSLEGNGWAVLDSQINSSWRRRWENWLMLNCCPHKAEKNDDVCEYKQLCYKI